MLHEMINLLTAIHLKEQQVIKELVVFMIQAVKVMMDLRIAVIQVAVIKVA